MYVYYNNLSWYYYHDYSKNSAPELKPKRDINKIKAQSEERWLSFTSESEWYGLRCDSQGQITSLILTEIIYLGNYLKKSKENCYARDIKMADNRICGRLPNTFSELFCVLRSITKYARKLISDDVNGSSI